MAKSTSPKALVELPAECPICRFQFPKGTLGWDKHIGAIIKHPKWHPEVTDPGLRQRLFREEFPEFFQHARTPSRRRAEGATPSPMTSGIQIATTTAPEPSAASVLPTPGCTCATCQYIRAIRTG